MTYLFVILGILLIPTLAQLYIMATYKKYLKVDSKGNISGFEVARKILDANHCVIRCTFCIFPLFSHRTH